MEDYKLVSGSSRYFYSLTSVWLYITLSLLILSHIKLHIPHVSTHWNCNLQRENVPQNSNFGSFLHDGLWHFTAWVAEPQLRGWSQVFLLWWAPTLAGRKRRVWAVRRMAAHHRQSEGAELSGQIRSLLWSPCRLFLAWRWVEFSFSDVFVKISLV